MLAVETKEVRSTVEGLFERLKRDGRQISEPIRRRIWDGERDAFGCILYEMFNGQRMVSGRTIEKLKAEHCQDNEVDLVYCPGMVVSNFI
jgi:hypothetical protein